MKSFHKATAIWIVIFIQFFLLLQPAAALTVKEEQEMSHEFLRMALAHYQVVDDPLITDYINHVGKKIVAVLPRQPYVFHFYVVKENVYNAFAGPAGHIFIHTGLLEALKSEDELAGILAHEISHVTCRHLSDMVEKSKTTTLATLAGVAAGIFLGAGGAGAAGSAITVGSIAAGQSLSLAYSRENELQADQIGLQHLEKVGYSAYGLLDSLKTIRSQNWFGTKEIPTYLMTHPAVDDRITYVGSWAESHEKDRRQPSERMETEFNRMQIRLIARYGDEQAALKKFEADVKEQPRNALIQCGFGLVLARNGRYQEAITHLQAALEQKPFDPIIVQDLGQIYFLDGQYDKALKMLETTGTNQAFNPESHVFLGRTQAALERYSQAVATFEEVITQKPDYLISYYYIGEAYGKQGRLGNAHYYLGIYYHKKRDLKTAGFHLRTALKQLTDPALIRAAEKQLAELQQEELQGLDGRP